MAEIAVKLATKAAEGLLSRSVGELSLLLGVRDEIRFIKDELQMMSEFLRRAEENSAGNAWVQQVRELAYAIEDCLDEFSLHLPPPRHNVNLAGVLWHHARSLGSLRERRRIAVEIRSIKTRAEDVSKRRIRYGIDDKTPNLKDDVNAVVQYDPRSAALFVEESELVGIEESKGKLVGWLLDDTSHPQLRLIAVVGAAGSGKTTVAKTVTESTGGHFECRAWITVSQTYHIDGLLRDVIKQVFPPPPQDLEKIERSWELVQNHKERLQQELDKMERRELVQKLRGHLQNKRYVIAFDDIWKLDAWNCLEDALPKNELGSRVLITTRNSEVANSCLARIPGLKHEQGKLSEDQSRELFCKRVFPDHQSCPEELEELMVEILKKCDRLPLAIVTTAAALASKPLKTQDEWRKMLDHFASELQSNPNLQGVLQVLNFSYTDLPYHVSKCFLYLSQFPEDHQIRCKHIKRLWIAEGLVNEHLDMSPEEVADSYLNILVGRRMILPSAFNIDGKLKSFTIHDMMLEMIISKCMDEDFISLHRKSSTRLPHGVIRRLSIHTPCIPTNMSSSHVRSLSMFGEALSLKKFQINFSWAFRSMRVLQLKGHEGFENSHLRVVCQYLVHLRYLNLRGTRVRSIPNTIGNLLDLEIFDLRGIYKILKIPSSILKLTKLRFLHGTLLRVPANVGRLTALEDLGVLDVKEEVLMGLRYLHHLRKLKLVDSNIHLRQSLNMMSSSLTSLTICTLHGANLTHLLDMEPAPLQLKFLKLEGDLVKLPNWFSSMDNLNRISLSEMKIGSQIISTLGSLPKLLRLGLSSGAFDGDALCFPSGSFRSLKLLRLCNKSLKSLIFEVGAMPCMEILHINNQEVDEIEDEIVGIEKLASLKIIYTDANYATTQTLLGQAIQAHPNQPRLIILSYSMFW